MKRFPLFLCSLLAASLPCLLADPLTENASLLVHTHPMAYWIWILNTVFWMWLAGRGLGPVCRSLPVSLLVLAGAIPYTAGGAGWINDLHVWLQVIALCVYGYGWLREWWIFQSLPSRYMVMTYGFCFGLLCLCGCVSGLAETAFAALVSFLALYGKNHF